jgi:hypothetical protein
MSEARTTQFLRQAFMALWAMATVVLVFAVALLVYELFESGRHPLPPVTESAAPDTPTRSMMPDAPPRERPVTLFFAGSDGLRLAPESRALALGDSTQENARLVLEALVNGPRETARVPILPPTVKVRHVYLLESGELVVDFSSDLRFDPTRPKSASAECLMVYGIVNTLAQEAVAGANDRRITRVRVLFEGSPLDDDAFPEHLDLADAVWPDRSWLAS